MHVDMHKRFEQAQVRACVGLAALKLVAGWWAMLQPGTAGGWLLPLCMLSPSLLAAGAPCVAELVTAGHAYALCHAPQLLCCCCCCCRLTWLLLSPAWLLVRTSWLMLSRSSQRQCRA